MKTKTFLLSVLILSSINSCIKEKTTHYSTFLHNQSPVDIDILPTDKGLIAEKKIINLKKGESINIASGIDRGIINNGGFDSEYFVGSELIYVVFNKTDTVLHYLYTPDSILETIKYFDYQHNRNLFNKDSYHYSYKDNSKHSRKALYDYNFTEEDYQYAIN